MNEVHPPYRTNKHQLSALLSYLLLKQYSHAHRNENIYRNIQVYGIKYLSTVIHSNWHTELLPTQTMSHVKPLLYMKLQFWYDLKLGDTVLVFRELRIHCLPGTKFAEQNYQNFHNKIPESTLVPTSAFFPHHLRWECPECPLQRFIAECDSVVVSRDGPGVKGNLSLRKRLAHSKPNSRNFDLLGSCLLTQY